MGGGLAALMGLLGGGGKGLYEGFSAGIGDQQFQQKLAENQRQFDQGQFTDISPEQATATGLPAGRTRNTLIPAFLQDLQKKQAQAEQLRRGELGAQSLEKAAAQYPEAMPRTGAMQEPEAAGIPPEQGPNRLLTMLAGRERAGVGNDPALVALLKTMGQQGQVSAGTKGRFQIITDENGQQRYMWLPTGGEPVEKTGPDIKGLTARSSEYQAARNRMIAEGWTPGTPAFDEELGKRIEHIVPLGPGQVGIRKSNIPSGGAYGPDEGMSSRMPPPSSGQVGRPPGYQEPTGQPSISRQFQPASSERDDLAALDAATQQLVSVREILRSGSLNNVMGGVGKNPKGALNRTTEKYLGYGMTDEQRHAIGVLSIQLQAVKHALIGATRTMPELADIAASIPDEKGILSGDTPEQAVAKIDALLTDLKVKRSARGQAMGSTDVKVPVPPVLPPTPPGPGKAGGPTLFPQSPPQSSPQSSPNSPPTPGAQQWPEGKRLYSPSQGKWGVIRNGTWVPE